MMKSLAVAAVILAALSAPLQAQQFQPCVTGTDCGMWSGNGMGMGMMGGRHVEGRLAFLKTELKINAAQEDAWQAYADALRANAGQRQQMMQEMMSGNMHGQGMMGQGMMGQGMMGQGMMGQGMMGQGMMGQGMMGQSMMGQAGAPPTIPERLNLATRHMAAHVEMLERMKAPTLKLYESLDPDQKQIADQLLMGPMGMM
ncbi:LTXXQ motif family protein [Dongia mobilis]|uniref:LTXXQ motif family protein n=1 Tax=Dongia mobilis TaxID=578943 RepID=A0A4R6WPS7_9PROT|nr:Spy/CpxP family protein refolding chaperone [Dongia mobilis]TDQ83241.1 LTXXQ motif family protein [Dongia mobilis]